MQALVVAPGGFGTCDELFELLTLKQTGKIQKSLPVVLLGKQYWKSIINWQTLGVYGVINPLEVDELAQYRSLLAQAHWPVNRVGSPDEEVSLSSRAALAASSALGWESTANEDARARRAGPPRTPPLLQATALSDDATCRTMAAALQGSATLREPRPRARRPWRA